MADATLELVRWPVGTIVGAYPRISEQILDDMPPTMVQAAQSSAVAPDGSLTFTNLPEGEYWACAPLGPAWQYVSFNAEDDPGGPVTGGLKQGAMQSFIDANGDFWLADNAVLEDGVWNRIDESRFSYAMQWIVNGVIPGEELIDPIGGIVFWRCIPGTNPIGPFAAFGGWENIYLVTQYRDFVIGGQAIEIDGAGTFPFGRVIHAPEGTWLGQNAYADLNGRDDPTKDSLVLGIFGDEFKARLWPANQPKASTVDLLRLNKSGDLWVAGAVPAPPLVAALPGSPSDGTTVRYQNAAMAALGVVWELRYRSGAAGSYKWEFVGGASLWVRDDATVGTTSVGYVDAGTAITAPLAGDYEVAFGADLQLPAQNASINSRFAVGVNGAPLNHTVIERDGMEAGANAWATRSKAGIVLSAVAAAATLRTMLASPAGATNAQARYRWLSVRPVRVG